MRRTVECAGKVMKLPSSILCLLCSLSLCLSTVSSEFVGKCSDDNSRMNVSLEDVQRYGVCEAYAGEATICNSVIQTSVDYVYIPHTRVSQYYISRFMNDAALVAAALPERCRDIAISLLCTFYFIPCGNSSMFYPPSSVCSEQCFHLRNLCPIEWQQAELFNAAREDLIANGLSFIDCNNTGLIIEPLPHCCTDAGVTLPPPPTSTDITASTVPILTSTRPTPTSTAEATPNVHNTESSSTLTSTTLAGVGGALVTCGLVAVIVIVAAGLARKRRRKRKEDVCLLQESPPLSPREGISFPSIKYNDLLEIGMLSACGNQYGKGLAPEKGSTARVPSTYLRRMSGKMMIPSHCIHLMDCVGQGEFGVVYRAYLSGWEGEPSQIVAVKTLKVMSGTGNISELLDESLKMKAFSHPNILNLIGICLDAGPAPYIVMPYMERGSLLQFLKKERPNFTIAEGADAELIITGQRKLLPMCLQIAKGMEYLAGERFVHRDLAARNCMIDISGVIKVADFGLSEDVYSKNYFRQEKGDAEVRLPIKWMALESLQDGVFSEKTDVWSFGVTCWEIFSLGRMPYPGVDPFSLIKFLEAGQRLEKPANAACTDEIYSIILRCWCENADKRPSFSKLVVDITTSLTGIAGYVDFSGLAVVDKEGEEGCLYNQLAEQDQDA